ncbi:MAG: OmpA family protein [Proteobacteria bacterium]|nr:OmpA family protein [Pseudomonadota bacterium]
MNKRLTGFFLLLLIGALLLFGGKYLRSYLSDRNQRVTSDAVHTKGTIRVAVDSWIGYFPLCSSEMKGEMHRVGWLLQCVDDKGDYQGRMAGLAEGKYEMVVATVDSYLLNGKNHDYPGAIVAVLDESKGGDAIVARRDKVANLDAIRTAGDLRVAFTPNSPSHYLLKAAANHFDLPALLPVRSDLRLEMEGSNKALAKLLAGTTDIAVLWEPDVSKALTEKAITKLLGTEETERLIVDILIAGRKFMQRQPEVISQFLAAYFKVLKKFRDDPDLLQREVMAETRLDKDATKAMLKGVVWQSLIDNCEKWFGIAGPGGKAEERIIPTLDSTVEILKESGDFRESPIPGKDNYRLLKRSFLEELYTSGVSGFTKARSGFGSDSSVPPAFSPLDARGWAALTDVGTLKLKPIIFQHGSSELDLLAGLELDSAAEKLTHYPNFRVIIKGHTGTRGDAQENMLLSQRRAEGVAEFLRTRHGIDDNRLHAVGFGGSKPLPQISGESLRAFEQRLLRVEMILVREEM